MLSAREESQALSDQWRSLRRSATFVAVLSAPAAFIWLWKSQDMALGWAIVATAAAVFAFRGLIDLVFRRLIPQPQCKSPPRSTGKPSCWWLMPSALGKTSRISPPP